MAKCTPIIVYLDTQDYINIQSHREESQILDVCRYLKAKIADGAIAIPNSPMIMLEFLTKPGVGSATNRIERGRIIKEFCGLYTFSMKTDAADSLLRTDGNWMGQDLTKDFSLSKILSRALNEVKLEINKHPNLNREARRRLSSERNLRSSIKSASTEFGKSRDDFGKIPVSQEFLDGNYINRFMQGKISEQTVQSAFCKWVTDPEEFCKIYYEYYNNPNAIDHFFSGAIKSLEEAVKKAQVICKIALDHERDRLRHRREMVESGTDKQIAKALTPKLQFAPNISDLKSRLENSLGKGRSDHFLTYYLAIAKGKSTWLGSDFGDLFHFNFAYDCDLFRCDVKMNNIMSDCAAISSKLVKSFYDLPAKIDDLLFTQEV